MMRFWTLGAATAVLFCAPMLACAQQDERRPMDVPDLSQRDAPQRQRLILKDGTYQLVLSYQVIGNIVRYKSAERNGAVEEVPLELVDLPATRKWFKDHQPGAKSAAQGPPLLSPELAREEADRAARTPEIAPGLHLPEEDSFLAVDTFEGTPELVPLPQQGSDLNKETGHAINKIAINPSSSAHRILDLRGDRSDIQLHVADPVFYVRVGPDAENDDGASAFVVDTHGTGRDTPSGGSPDSGYVIERVDVRYDARQVDSFRLGLLGTGKKQPDIIEMKMDLLPGGHWLKLTPLQPLEFGEYALVEVLSGRDLNLNVWDFGVHPNAPENVEAQRPVVKRNPSLERRPQ